VFDGGLNRHEVDPLPDPEKRLLVILLFENTDESQGSQQDFPDSLARFREHVVFREELPDFPLNELAAFLRKALFLVP